MIVQRIEKHLIKQNNPYYRIFSNFTHKSKNLYNHANFLVRDEFIRNNKWLRYGEIDKILKADLEFDDYKQMPTAQSAQQILRLLEKDWKSFFTAIKDWSKNKDKYLGRPKLPKYKAKDGKHILILTNQNVKLKDGVLVFPKTFCGFVMRPQFIKLDHFVSFQQVRFIPNYKSFIVELVYNIEVLDEALPDLFGDSYKIKDHKFYVVTQEGYAVIDQKNIAKILLTVPESEYTNGYSINKNGEKEPYSRFIDNTNIQYIMNFDEFTESEQKVLNKLIN